MISVKAGNPCCVVKRIHIPALHGKFGAFVVESKYLKTDRLDWVLLNNQEKSFSTLFFNY
ncbi:hypothetical protein [Oceanobacillus jeddahense]|uniref:hypothetical protein n=1 Tax=Oceanobacillus jeddahense TaxID=1462527 RepID=UPI0011DCC254|nr:hypothetical protein [Oceanobacillus jeddahense]